MIKAFNYLLSLVTILVLTFCSSENKEKTESNIFNMDTIKVGMTYDEVEKILNKPNSIVRGVNDLIRSNNQIAVIENYGTLLYVVWIYKQEKIDTGSYIYLDYNLAVDTSFYKEDKFYQGEYEISKEKYERIRATREKEKIDTSYSKKSRASKFEIKKKTFNRFKVDERYEISTVFKVNYDIMSKLAVIFDASSGRVVDRKYMPIMVVPKDTIDVKNKLLKDEKKIS